MRFGNGLPRQSADWLAMTGFFDSLRPQRESLRLFYVLYKSDKKKQNNLEHKTIYISLVKW